MNGKIMQYKFISILGALLLLNLYSQLFAEKALVQSVYVDESGYRISDNRGRDVYINIRSYSLSELRHMMVTDMDGPGPHHLYRFPEGHKYRMNLSHLALALPDHDNQADTHISLILGLTVATDSGEKFKKDDTRSIHYSGINFSSITTIKELISIMKKESMSYRISKVYSSQFRTVFVDVHKKDTNPHSFKMEIDYAPKYKGITRIDFIYGTGQKLKKN